MHLLATPRLVLLAELCLCLLSGHAYRYCDADGNWHLVANMNKTWANYTECAVFFAPEQHEKEKVELFNTMSEGKGRGKGIREEHRDWWVLKEGGHDSVW